MTAIALELARKYYGQVACALLVLFVYLYAKQSGELSAYKLKAEKAQADLVQVQEQSAKALSNCKGSIRIGGGESKPCPPTGICPPCPEVNVSFEANGNGETHQSMTQSANTVKASDWAWYAGGGLTQDGGHLMLGLSCDSLLVYGLGGNNYGGGLAYRRGF